MLRLHNLQKLLITPTPIKSAESVRWRRKPRWLPVARSKLFRVPPRTVTPIEEKLELMRLYNNYRTQMKGIRSYLHGQYNVKSVIVDTEEHEKRFMEEFKECCKINDAWNNERKLERELRHSRELEATKLEALKRLDDYKLRQDKLLEVAEDLVKKEKVLAKTFITPETLDEAIEYALKNPVDYNFAIDLNGSVFQGRDTTPETITKSNTNS